MAQAQWLLELVLILLLAATLFHALRLERALGVLKRDRAVLEELVAGFNESTRLAESGIDRLRAAADGAGRQIARQIEQAQLLRDDLTFLVDRSDKLAERLEVAVRSARMVQDAPPGAPNPVTAMRDPASLTGPSMKFEGPAGPDPKPELESELPRLRSQAERDLLHALRSGR